jgi:hypothetical protein
VEYERAAGAGAAVGALDGREVLGRRLAVMPSEAGAGSSGVAPRHTLYVSNLPYDATAEDIKTALAAAGIANNPIESVRVLKGRKMLCAVILF